MQKRYIMSRRLTRVTPAQFQQTVGLNEDQTLISPDTEQVENVSKRRPTPPLDQQQQFVQYTQEVAQHQFLQQPTTQPLQYPYQTVTTQYQFTTLQNQGDIFLDHNALLLRNGALRQKLLQLQERVAARQSAAELQFENARLEQEIATMERRLTTPQSPIQQRQAIKESTTEPRSKPRSLC